MVYCPDTARKTTVGVGRWISFRFLLPKLYFCLFSDSILCSPYRGSLTCLYLIYQLAWTKPLKEKRTRLSRSCLTITDSWEDCLLLMTTCWNLKHDTTIIGSFKFRLLYATQCVTSSIN